MYLGGAAIGSNIKAWATVGRVLLSVRDAYAAEHEQRGGTEAGLSPSLADRALEVAKQVDAELTSSGTLPALERKVVAKLVDCGHTKVLSTGPHAALTAEIATARAAGLDVGQEAKTSGQLKAAERSLNSLTLGLWR